ncbi:hypothetical protein LRP50_03055 [Enterovibrio sp. ZSDZ42]|uniref:Uncharacterized protein n=1 Tax=Enterovibrio gelatinilyticus TaxID=2899819 RepID=A0ABT5QVS5_9GAMM|nr:hypothetical protein [Enterovibrio sp. ZSDZ42]MDD1792099.1 hypothetical protein [Enterovibrio sp. ZSDZ42]
MIKSTIWTMKLALMLTIMSSYSVAGEADVVNATATKSGEFYRFSATVAHADEGWDHYANAWRVVTKEGDVLGVRELLHPHENEQPFTRSLSGVSVPEGVTEVIVEARDSVHGWGGKTFEIGLE